MRRLVLAAALAAVACGKQAPCPPLAALPPPSEAPAVAIPRAGSLTRKPARAVDAAAGPDGKLWVAAIVNGPGRARARTFAWDPATARVVPGTERRLHESDKEDLGEPLGVRVAIAGGRGFVAHETDRDVVTVFTFDGGVWNGFRGGREISLAASARHVALAATVRPGLVAVHVYDAVEWQRDAPEVALVDVTAPTADRAARASSVAFLGERLFVLHRAVPGRLRVTELALPSLKPLRSWERASRGARSRARLVAAEGHLHVLDAGVLTELTPDLEVARERPFDADDLALGPAAELLSPTGRGPGRRGDVVPALGGPASCTPAWLGEEPLLACAVDGESSRAVRLDK